MSSSPPSPSASTFVVERVEVKNFRRFRSLGVELESDLTLFAASNAGGKTALLDALAIVLGTYVGAFDLARGRLMTQRDVHVATVGSARTPEPQFPAIVAASILDASGEPFEATRGLRGAKSKMDINRAGRLRDLGRELQQAVRDGEDVVLPTVAYYGTARAFGADAAPLERRGDTSRTAGYQDCLESRPRFEVFSTWLRWATLAQLQQRQDNRAPTPAVDAVVTALARTLPAVLSVESEHAEQRLDCRDVRFDLAAEEIVADFSTGGNPAVQLPLASLSDGVRAVVALAADLALRMAILNPHLGADAVTAPGIVLIDEVDLYLHPRWQQQVVPALREAFPNLQMVMSTHSAQVISTVEGRCIRQLDLGGDARVAHTLGQESGRLLSRVQHVPERPPGVDVVQDLRRYLTLIDDGLGDTDEARELRRELDDRLGGPQLDSDLLRAERLRRVRRPA